MIRYRRAGRVRRQPVLPRRRSAAPQINLFNLNLDALPHTPNFLYLWSP